MNDTQINKSATNKRQFVQPNNLYQYETVLNSFYGIFS